MKIITGNNKINDGDKNKLNLKTSKNSSRLYSKRVPEVNKNTIISQNAKKPIIIATVKTTVFIFVKSKTSIIRYAFKVKRKKSIIQINQNTNSYGLLRAK